MAEVRLQFGALVRIRMPVFNMEESCVFLRCFSTPPLRFYGLGFRAFGANWARTAQVQDHPSPRRHRRLGSDKPEFRTDIGGTLLSHHGG